MGGEGETWRGGEQEADEMCVWKEEQDKTKIGYNWIYFFCRFYLNSPRDKSQGDFFLWLAWMTC